jgi:hypothetical protein
MAGTWFFVPEDTICAAGGDATVFAVSIDATVDSVRSNPRHQTNAAKTSSITEAPAHHLGRRRRLAVGTVPGGATPFCASCEEERFSISLSI